MEPLLLQQTSALEVHQYLMEAKALLKRTVAGTLYRVRAIIAPTQSNWIEDIPIGLPMSVVVA